LEEKRRNRINAEKKRRGAVTGVTFPLHAVDLQILNIRQHEAAAVLCQVAAYIF
jgi:hypothetical protein